MAKVTVFTSPTCPHCTSAKAYLKENNIDFEERDVTKDSEARKELIEKGYRGVPVIRVDEEDMVGFDQARLAELLGL